MDIVSIFEVVTFKRGQEAESYREAIIGSGEAAVKAVRALYPKYTKFVLEGFEIDGKFTRLKIQ